jgi:hypothetical protein
MLALPQAQLLGVDRRGEGAAGREVRKQDRLLWRQHGRSLSHEVDAAEHDDVGVGVRGLAGQSERIADEVRDVLHFGALVVVREDHGVTLGRQLPDLVLEGSNPGVGSWNSRHRSLEYNGLRA